MEQRTLGMFTARTPFLLVGAAVNRQAIREHVAVVRPPRAFDADHLYGGINRNSGDGHHVCAVNLIAAGGRHIESRHHSREIGAHYFIDYWESHQIPFGRPDLLDPLGGL